MPHTKNIYLTTFSNKIVTKMLLYINSVLRVVGMEIVFSWEPNRGLFYRNEKENETEKRKTRRGNTSYHDDDSYAGGDGGREREVSG